MWGKENWEKKMAMPIGTTPVLGGRDAEKFAQMVADGLKNPVGLTPTPKIDRLKRIIRNKNAKK
jgi:hypothetical protein